MGAFIQTPIANGVKASRIDRYGGPLSDKLIAGTGMTINEYSVSGNVKLRLSASSSASNTYVSINRPTVNNDGVDTAGIGRVFEVGECWIDTTDAAMYVCYNNSTGAAAWRADIYITVTGLAAEDITAYKVVNSTFYIANSATVANYGKIIGIAYRTTPAGSTVSVICSGMIVNSGWTWTPGAILYLNGTSISETCPTSGLVCVVGQALAATVINVSPGVSFIVGA